MNDKIHVQYSLENNELKNVNDGEYPLKFTILVRQDNQDEYQEIPFVTNKKVVVKSELISVHTLEEAFKEYLTKSIEMDERNKRKCFYMESCEFDEETKNIILHWGT